MVSAAETGGPAIRNILFLVSDDLKASVLGCYGDTICQTPHIDRLAERGMVFERAYCQGTWCKPSRTSFMRSRYRDKGNPTLGEHLRNHGVHTARVGKIFHMRVPGDTIDGTNGLDVPECWTERYNAPGREAHTPGEYACLNLDHFTSEAEGRESTAMRHRMFVTVRHEGDGIDQPDWKAATKSIELLGEWGEGPFFLAAGFVRPHYPSVAPQRSFDLYPHERMPLHHVPEGDLDDIPKAGRPGLMNENSGIGEFPDNIRRMWAAYYATVTFMDEQVGRVLDELDRLGLSDSTAIVFTSDHGYHLGEHEFWQKSNLHEEVVRVPLIIAAPGLAPGRTQALAELVDLYPTLCELTGIPVPEGVEGRSLLPVLRDPSARVRDVAVAFDRQGQLWRTEDWAYMRYRDGAEELYDMDRDPGQFTNLVAREDAGEALARMREVADRWGEGLEEPGALSGSRETP